ncbi:nitrate reductase cytochrome c-type subunit [Actinobacillus genomosp. 1]|uniref:nitrate reductase cytochrome c-type subunit n=1 Tax=Actinobacillus genomosp. 1 TaxID=254839 RepID=UPI00244123EB|nr:nitrate reductase cytochrome c-type subunit [Actinobacillus genomosp. 1]WGE33452.1 nitrate reductase cytochrome c-type subunit [Actinobacillus genomosp. 1]WGE35497.1 nitrate reductase cytochrome c-type subunit [Actinobacillus genomosp. 1]WGE90766.1 nitrate reductase cytochrome c-type subunit [Actinobacillus genomosp. 1]
MRKYLALILTAITGFAVAETQNLSLDKLPENVAPAYTNPHKDVGNIPTTFPHQPPLVPHSIRGLQVTKNTNQCLGCHAPEVSSTTGAPRVPKTHFMDRDGKLTEGTSPRRYFCLQCHVQQTDVNPIIQNKFETIRQTQGK